MSPILPSTVDESFLHRQKVCCERAKEIDFQFLKSIVSSKEFPEYNGFCSLTNRNQGYLPRPKTSIAYLTLLDMMPASPTTMKTSIISAKKLSKEHGQAVCVFTCDQQLYRITLNVLFDAPDLAKDLFARLGGIHLLMSYVGSIGSLMSGAGLVEILEKVFGGVLKMLSGKKFPDNVRALRLLVKELL